MNYDLFCTLKYLNLRKCKLEEVSGSEIIDSISVNDSLKQLNLSGNDFSKIKSGDFYGVGLNNALLKLNLSECGLYDGPFELLSLGLQHSIHENKL